jgi:hypothetical protein
MATTRRHFRLTHPDLDFYVDVTVHERDRCFMATADMAEDSRVVARASLTRLAMQSGWGHEQI